MRGVCIRAFTPLRPSLCSHGSRAHVRVHSTSRALPRLILGIESSCDDTGVGIVSPDGRILGASLAGQAAIHAAWGGVVPNLAQEAHAAAMEGCIAEALDQAGVRPQDLAAVAVTVGPGLSLCLKVGVRAARQLAATHGLPLIPVHHMEAHALMARMGSGVRFPYLCALVSGGHNLLTLVHDVGRYTLLGTSLDDAAGEAYDKVARMLGLPLLPSGGAAVEAAAARGDPAAFPFTVPMARQANCNFSFAGLKTAVRVAAGRHLPAEGQPLRGKVQDDLAAGFQRAAVRHLADRTARAAQWAAASDPGVRHLVVSGGVAANAAVRAALSDVAARAGLELVAPPPALCADNGVMVAWAAQEAVAAGAATLAAPPPAPVAERDWEDVKPRWPLTGERHPNMAAEAARSAKKQRIFPSLTQLVAEQAAMEAAQTP
ncbi:hypothetical protein ACKKBG_A36220 [Auxenochlorella protothecoides x Auxenochlorella symbiontica]